MLLKGTLKAATPKNESLNTIFKLSVSKCRVSCIQAETNPWAPKNWFYAVYVVQIHDFLYDYQLIFLLGLGLIYKKLKLFLV